MAITVRCRSCSRWEARANASVCWSLCCNVWKTPLGLVVVVGAAGCVRALLCVSLRRPATVSGLGGARPAACAALFSESRNNGRFVGACASEVSPHKAVHWLVPRAICPYSTLVVLPSLLG